MKKIIILLMAVSVILTSCGKSAGLLNGDKKTDNKIPANNTGIKLQPQKNNEAGNKTPATNTSTKLQPQKKDNAYNVEQFWTVLIYSSFVLCAVIVVASFFINCIDEKNENQPKPEDRSEPSILPRKRALSSTSELSKPSIPRKRALSSETLKPGKPSKKLKPLPALRFLNIPLDIVNLFAGVPDNNNYESFNFYLLADNQLVYIYSLVSTLPNWRPYIKNRLKKLGYNVSTL